MKRLLLPLSLTFLVSSCGLSDLERRYYEIEQTLIDDSIKIYRQEANRLTDKAYEYKRKGNAIGTKMFTNDALGYHLKIMKLSRYGMCLDIKLKQELKFNKGKAQCVSEIGIDPRKPNF